MSHTNDVEHSVSFTSTSKDHSVNLVAHRSEGLQKWMGAIKNVRQIQTVEKAKWSADD